MTEPSASGAVIIAAHNEETVIERCLRSLEEAIADGLQVVVACNGCTDRTAELARQFAGVDVIELDVASKVAALRAGDRLVAGGSRIYLDADIVMTSTAVRDVLAALGGGTALAARPPVSFDRTGAAFLVCRWYAVRERLPSIQRALWGAGCYALSARGRERFSEFPDIVSDDLFIHSLFEPAETVIVDTQPVVVSTPRATSDLVRILQRSYRTQREVHSNTDVLSAGQQGQLRDIVGLLRRSPRRLGDVIIYVSVILYSRMRARLARSSRWERDTSSRLAGPAT
jgi:glycosyltransferase involved in cell wall biosynthesis